MDRKTVFILIPVIVSIAINALDGNVGMIDYYCHAGSTFLWADLSGSVYCYTYVYLIHVIGISAFFVFPLAAWDKCVEIIERRAKFRYETDDEIYDGILNLTIFNDGNDLENRFAKYIGFGVLKDGSVIKEQILPPKDRILNWADSDKKIQSGHQGTINRIVTVDWEGVRFGRMGYGHSDKDETTWRVGIELTGKIRGGIIKKNICITFAVNKITKGKYLIVKPSVCEGDCEWAKEISVEEYKKILSKKAQ